MITVIFWRDKNDNGNISEENCRCFLCWKMGLSPLAWTEDWFIKTVMMFYLVHCDYKWIVNFCNGMIILHKMIMLLIVLRWAPQEYLDEHHRARRDKEIEASGKWQPPKCHLSLCNVHSLEAADFGQLAF